MIDLTTYTDEQLEELRGQVLAEEQRRFDLVQIPAQMDSLVNSWRQMKGLKDGEEWVRPTHAQDAYPKGAKAVRAGVTYESRIPANVAVPGEDPNGRWWANLTDVPAAGEWAPGIPVNPGETYQHAGKAYDVVQAHNTQAGWEPPVVPALWKAKPQ